MLVQDRGDEAPVHDARPARGARAEVDDGDGLARPAVAPHVLVPAQAARPAQGPRRDARRPGVRGEALVRLVVAGGPVPVREETLHDGQVRRRLADVGGQGGVDLGAGEEGRGRGQDGAEAGTGCGA